MWWIALVLGCSRAPTPPEPTFVRDGILLAEGDGRALPDGRVLVERAWSPGDEVDGAVAPRVAECVPLFQVPLGDVSRHVLMGGGAPDTALAFSPDGSRLAVGDYTGQLLVVDAWTGEVLARRRLAETLVKRVAWSPDGRTLYAAEQSPDAYVHALDPATLASRARLRLADEVGTSAPPDGDDLYGVYALPAAYALEVLPDGDLVVAATHGWDEGGRRLNRARVLRLGPGLERRAAWPEDGPADAVFRSMHLERGLVAVPLGRSADGAPPDLPIGGVQVLDLDLRPVRSVAIEPLAPWFDDVFVWEALAFGPDGRLAVGLGDGRVVVEGGPVLPLGAPILVGEVPVAAAVGQLAWPGALLAVTARTNIPWGAASPELRPPGAHPAENALTAYTLDSEGGARVAWTFQGPHVLQGLTPVPGRGEVVVGAGARDTDRRRDLFGALILDLEREGSGADRLSAWCPTEGPVFFRHTATPDGRVAVAEFPWDDGQGLSGAYRVTVFR